MKTLLHDCNLGVLYNASPKIWGSPKKFGGQKHAKFGADTTSHLDRNYQVKISKIGKICDLVIVGFTVDKCRVVH